ncbi:hypothetical protein NP493_836g01049 [Ridgeia piscesae]|uniref:Kinesin-like protein 6 n=1 Tax=Ridgeia piscesae TaxID=27915 RepID=A0AAD9KMB7_RIDPI|nr:hypothetical protein NP493_836g01049 [Ridgeia piscesae]
MSGPTTYLDDPDEPEEEPRSFAFDFSYWSFDGSLKEENGYYGPDKSHPNGGQFVGQQQVYNDLGVGVLKNAWEGYNTTLFAYGQTGSGKSWSIVGYGVNKGVVPILCEELFKGIDKKKEAGDKTEYEILFSMLEIYMEEVRDLLSTKKKRKGGLRIRQHPNKGFYADGLTNVAVADYDDIAARMEAGTANRTVAATRMNATSSRAHTIVGITFVQRAKNAAGETTDKTAVVNLVDLAGSERAANTGATGSRLKEGAAINQSLSSLGNCIAALADRSAGKKVRVPFRNSSLTKLLKNALGGNSKTIMIAAISPADINYEESLSTLRYADRAKQIKTVAKVNEDPTEKLIRELQEENKKLKEMLASGKLPAPRDDDDSEEEEDGDLTDAEKAALRKELEEEYKVAMEENARAMEAMKKTFEQKLNEAKKGDSGTTRQIESNKKRKTVAHIYNLNFDPQLSGRIVHFIEGDHVTVGNQKGDPCNITLMGPSILPQHAEFTVKGDKFHVKQSDPDARVLVNGDQIHRLTAVTHGDRLMFGSTQLYVFCMPKKPEPDVTFESAQEEIATKSGEIEPPSEQKSKKRCLLQEDLVDLRPDVAVANSISEELDKQKSFEIILLSPEARGLATGRLEIFVRVVDLVTGLEWIWSREKFLDRKCVMDEMFAKFEDGEKWQPLPEDDPFEEDDDTEVLVGSVKVWLGSLAYSIDIREQLDITDYRGNKVGQLNIELVPCSAKGREFTDSDDVWIEGPDELVGKDFHFVVRIKNALGLPERYSNIYAEYQLADVTKDTSKNANGAKKDPSGTSASQQTNTVTPTAVTVNTMAASDTDFVWSLATYVIKTKVVKEGPNPAWNHTYQFDYVPASEQLVKYLRSGAVYVLIKGQQRPVATHPKTAVATKETMKKRSNRRVSIDSKISQSEKTRLSMELALMSKKADKAEKRMTHVKRMVYLAEQYEKPRLRTKLIHDVLYAQSEEAAEKCLKQIPKEKVIGK